MNRSCSCCGASSGCWQLHWGRCSYCCCAHTPASPRRGPETNSRTSVTVKKPQLIQLNLHWVWSEPAVLFVPSGRRRPPMGKISHIHLWKRWGSAGGCWWELWPQTQWGWRGASLHYSEKGQIRNRTLTVNHILQIKQTFLFREAAHLCQWIIKVIQGMCRHKNIRKTFRKQEAAWTVEDRCGYLHGGGVCHPLLHDSGWGLGQDAGGGLGLDGLMGLTRGQHSTGSWFNIYRHTSEKKKFET